MQAELARGNGGFRDGGHQRNDSRKDDLNEVAEPGHRAKRVMIK